MEREANTSAASMAKQRKAAPTLELDSTGLSLLCTTWIIQVILPRLKPYPDSEAGTTGVRLALYASKEEMIHVAVTWMESSGLSLPCVLFP